MRKKIIGVAIMAAIALTAGWNMNQNENEVNLSDLASDNIEALAWGESGNGTFHHYRYRNPKPEGGYYCYGEGIISC